MVEDQVKVEDVPTSTSKLLAERLTDIVWIGSGSRADPPPPPHAEITRRHKDNAKFFILIEIKSSGNCLRTNSFVIRII